MYVKVGKNLVRLDLQQVSDKLPHGEGFWGQLLVWMPKHSVHVFAHHAAPRISDHNTVSIDHRDDLEDELFSQLHGYLVLTQQELNHAVDYP